MALTHEGGALYGSLTQVLLHTVRTCGTFEMLEVFFGCSFSLRLPLLLLLSALLLAGELSGRPFFGFFSCAVLTLSVSLLFMRLNSGDDTGVPESMLFAGGVFLLIGLLTAEEAGTHSPEDHAAHSAKRTRADSPEKPAVHSVKEPRARTYCSVNERKPFPFPRESRKQGPHCRPSHRAPLRLPF